MEPESPPPYAVLETGARVGRYVVVGPARAAAIGRVYRAFDPQLNRPVALELLTADGPEARARLLREAQAIARLNHPNLVAVYDVGQHGDAIFLATELVEGVSLRDWMKQAPHTPREIADVFLEAGRAVAAAHDAGLIYRDFKPSNVLVARDGQVKVLDFGLVAAAESAALAQLSTASSIELSHLATGSVGYVAPEQLRGEPGDARVDQFAFGVALHEALSGDRPWPGRTMAEVAAAMRARPSPPPVPGAPLWLQAVVARAIRVEPAERFDSMKQLLAALSADPVRVRRKALIAVAVALAAVGIIVGAVINSRPVCDPAAKLAPIWNPETKKAIAAKLESTRRPGARETADRAIGQLNAWAADWIRESAAACEAQLKHPADEAAPPRIECLERRRAELNALVTVFADADRVVLDHAVSASKLLAPPARCREPQLLSGAPIHGPPDDVAKASALRDRLALAKAWLDTGLVSATIEPARKISDEAAAAKLALVEAEALDLLGKAQGPNAAASTFAGALAAARAAHSDLETFTAAIGLARADRLTGKPSEAELEVQQGEAALAKLGNDELLGADLLEARAGIAALAHQLDSARELRQQVREIRRRLLGEDHPETISATLELAKTFGDLHRLQEAADLQRQALETSTRSLGKDNPALVLDSCGVCDTLTGLGEYDEARRDCDEGARLAAKLDGETSALNGWCLSKLSKALAAAGKGDDAIAAADRAVVILGTVHGPSNRALAEPLLYRARGLLALGHTGQARMDLLHAKELAEQSRAANDPSLAEYLTTEGWLDLAEGRATDAVPLLERALVLRTGAFAGDRAETRLALARALWDSNGNRARAVELAKTASTELTGISGLAKRKAQVEQWLASLPR